MVPKKKKKGIILLSTNDVKIDNTNTNFKPKENK
jgi:hypothetical protein